MLDFEFLPQTSCQLDPNIQIHHREKHKIVHSSSVLCVAWSSAITGSEESDQGRLGSVNVSKRHQKQLSQECDFPKPTRRRHASLKKAKTGLIKILLEKIRVQVWMKQIRAFKCTAIKEAFRKHFQWQKTIEKEIIIESMFALCPRKQ